MGTGSIDFGRGNLFVCFCDSRSFLSFPSLPKLQLKDRTDPWKTLFFPLLDSVSIVNLGVGVSKTQQARVYYGWSPVLCALLIRQQRVLLSYNKLTLIETVGYDASKEMLRRKMYPHPAPNRTSIYYLLSTPLLRVRTLAHLRPAS
jgi:hypothetical protein